MDDQNRVEVTVKGAHSKTAVVLLVIVLAVFALLIAGSFMGRH